MKSFFKNVLITLAVLLTQTIVFTSSAKAAKSISDSVFFDDYILVKSEAIVHSKGDLNYFIEKNRRSKLDEKLNLLPGTVQVRKKTIPNYHYVGKVISTPSSALVFIAKSTIVNSSFFPYVSKELLIDDLTERISNPKGLNQGMRTKFCWAASFSSYLVQKDPEGIAKSIIDFYETGVWEYGNLSIIPSTSIFTAIGSDTFYDNYGLDKNVVDQMLVMILATRYLGYINIDQTYHPGDEEKAIYAGRPIQCYERLFKDFGLTFRKVGADMRWKGNNAKELEDLKEGNIIFLYVNSDYLFKKKKISLHGSHYVVLESIKCQNKKVTFTYWDYGNEDGKTVTMSRRKFNKGTFGAIILPEENCKSGLTKLLVK